MDRNINCDSNFTQKKQSLSARRAWIEMTYVTRLPRAQVSSLSARRAWIEITYVTRLPRAQVVALRKESVDRNNGRFRTIHNTQVALRKESVDRNTCYLDNIEITQASLSARRAWIEITRPSIAGYLFESLSARRAWIEIPAGCWRDSRRAVALRKESVDRNC